jgi:hypothetical protein
MRNTRLINSLSHAVLRAVVAGGLACCGWGCHQHYYYYGNQPGCPPGTVMPSTVTTGPLCDVFGDGTAISSNASASANSTRSTTISDGRKSRVVVSEPAEGKPRFGWRMSDPEAPPAMTQVEGAYEDSPVKR